MDTPQNPQQPMSGSWKPPEEPKPTPQPAPAMMPATPPAPPTPPPVPPKPPMPTPPPVTPPPAVTQRQIRREMAAWQWILGLGVVLALIILGYYLLKPVIDKFQPATSTSTAIDTGSPPSDTTTNEGSTTPTTTSTSNGAAETSTSTDQFGGLQVYGYGTNAQLFAGDEIVYTTRISHARPLKLQATDFPDSRCKPGNTCIWAGELAVKIHVTDLTTNATEDIQLGLKTKRVGTIFGHRITLKDIDEGKGGTFALIRVD